MLRMPEPDREANWAALKNGIQLFFWLWPLVFVVYLVWQFLRPFRRGYHNHGALFSGPNLIISAVVAVVIALFITLTPIPELPPRR